MMDDLIKALQILGKYQAARRWPTNCVHDVLLVMGVKEDAPSAEERAELNSLGFTWMDEYGCWGSHRFGSA